MLMNNQILYYNKSNCMISPWNNSYYQEGGDGLRLYINQYEMATQAIRLGSKDRANSDNVDRGCLPNKPNPGA